MEVDWHACQHHVYISSVMHLSKEVVHLLIYSLVQWHSQGQFAVSTIYTPNYFSRVLLIVSLIYLSHSAI